MRMLAATPRQIDVARGFRVARKRRALRNPVRAEKKAARRAAREEILAQVAEHWAYEAFVQEQERIENEQIRQSILALEADIAEEREEAWDEFYRSEYGYDDYLDDYPEDHYRDYRDDDLDLDYP